jgi:hypothetical protein
MSILFGLFCILAGLAGAGHGVRFRQKGVRKAYHLLRLFS